VARGRHAELQIQSSERLIGAHLGHPRMDPIFNGKHMENYGPTPYPLSLSHTHPCHPNMGKVASVMRIASLVRAAAGTTRTPCRRPSGWRSVRNTDTCPIPVYSTYESAARGQPLWTRVVFSRADHRAQSVVREWRDRPTEFFMASWGGTGRGHGGGGWLGRWLEAWNCTNILLGGEWG
jgi:hypothetical protein